MQRRKGGQKITTVKSSNFVRGSKFRHPKNYYLEPPARFISQDMNFFQKHTLFEIFFSFDLILCQKGVNMAFLKIYTLSDFVTKLIFKTKKNLPENTNKEGTYKTAIPMKYSSKFLKRRKVQKKLSFSCCLPFFEGMTKLEAFQ